MSGATRTGPTRRNKSEWAAFLHYVTFFFFFFDLSVLGGLSTVPLTSVLMTELVRWSHMDDILILLQ